MVICLLTNCRSLEAADHRPLVLGLAKTGALIGLARLTSTNQSTALDQQLRGATKPTPSVSLLGFEQATGDGRLLIVLPALSFFLHVQVVVPLHC